MPSPPTKKEAKGKAKAMPKQKPKQKQKQRQTNTQKVRVSVNIGRGGGKSQAQPTIFPTIQLGQPPILPNMIARESNDKFDKEVARMASTASLIKDAVRQATQEFFPQSSYDKKAPRQTVGLANVSAPIDEYLSQQINQVTPVARKPTSVKSSPPALQRFTQVYGNPVANRSKASPTTSGIGARSDMFSAIASTPSRASIKSSSTDRAIREYKPVSANETLEERALRQLNNQKIRDKAPKYGIEVSQKDRVDLLANKIRKAKQKSA